MRKLLVALALLGVLVLGMGCAQKAGAPVSGAGIPSAAASAQNLTPEDLGSLDNPDSESLDTGSLENI